MLGRRQEINLQLTELFDSALLAFCLWFAHFVRSRLAPVFLDGLVEIPPIEDFYWVMAVVAPFGPIILEGRGFYANLLNKPAGRSMRQMLEGVVIMGMIVGALMVFMRWQVPSRSVVLLSTSFAGMALLLRESWQRESIRRKLRSGSGRERVLMAGSVEDIRALEATLTDEQLAEIEVVGRIDLLANPVSDLVKLLHQESVARVLFAAQHVHFGKIEEAVQACETEGVEAWIAADFFQTAIARPTFDVVGGRLMLVFHSTPQVSWELWFKEIVDRVGALALLVISLPFWLIAAVGVRLSSPGPVFFRQERCGRYGHPFWMWKFRTMHVDAESQREALEAANELEGPAFKLRDDPRVFGFGKFLRRMSIDELPQLINVIKGEMSLVGPRPLPVYEIKKIEKHAQRRRLSVKPGLTCLWQVTGRNGIRSFDEWVALDLQYIDNWSLWLDAKILWQTVPAVLRRDGAH